MIHNHAECDNCGELLKVTDVLRYPDGWGMLSYSYVSGSGLDKKVSHRDRMLCPRCVAGANKGLSALDRRVSAAPSA